MRLILLFLGWILVGTPVLAADPQPYRVSLEESGDGDLDSALKAASLLTSLQDKAPVSPFSLKIRARQDEDRLGDVLQGFGYYQAKIGVTIDGKPLDDPDLVEGLEDRSGADPVEVHITLDKGPLFHIGHIGIEGDVTEQDKAKLELKPGDPAIASKVLDAGGKLAASLQAQGYALAKVDPPQAEEDPEQQALDLAFTVKKGPKATIGWIDITGLRDIKEDFVRRRLTLKTGQPYRPDAIDKARQDLLSLGVFSSVSVKTGDKLDENGGLPVTFVLAERPGHTVGVSAAYSTDLGGLLKATWSDHDLFGEAEQLNLSAAGTGFGGSDVKGLGYDLSAQFIKPDFLRRDQSLEIDVSAVKQDLEAYNQTAQTLGFSISRKLDPEWSVSAGIRGTRDLVAQEGVSRLYHLVGLPLTLRYDSTGLTDPLKEPVTGLRAALNLTPTTSVGDSLHEFLIAQISGSAYYDLSHLGLSDPGRSVLAVRGLVGSIQGAAEFDLPPDQRFYGGGSATVRGFKYQSIGPLFPDNNPTGGTAIDAAGIELRQRLYDEWGFATFLDAGQVSAGGAPFSGTVRAGVGAGPRYYTSIGVVRLDFAVPVNKPPGGDKFELYLGLGQAF
ncbi:MAG TPA: BamA/TamA family outer membrane protein [Magnetospirillaceae bacterium]|nr:BamA/TamA family outer membrane protein [Magnetospirillaceae bacterium]